MNFLLIIWELKYGKVGQFGKIVKWGQFTVIESEIFDGWVGFDEVFDFAGEFSDGNTVQLKLIELAIIKVLLDSFLDLS